MRRKEEEIRRQQRKGKLFLIQQMTENSMNEKINAQKVPTEDYKMRQQMVETFDP